MFDLLNKTIYLSLLMSQKRQNANLNKKNNRDK